MTMLKSSGQAHTSPLPFHGPPPHREQWVEQQRTSFRPNLWKKALSADERWWPPQLDNAAASIDRRLVFAIGRGATEPATAAHTFLAASVWGSGNRRIKFRTAPCIHGYEKVGSQLADAAQCLRTDGPVAAFASLSRNGAR